MDKEESKQAFKDANTFYRVGQYTQALAVLEKLDDAHPNDRHILFPMARCYHKLNRVPETAVLLDRILELEDDYEPAKQMRDQIQREATDALEIPDVQSSMGSAFASPSAGTMPPPITMQSGPGYLSKALWVAIPLLTLIGLAYLHARWGQDFLTWSEKADTDEAIPTLPTVIYLLEVILIAFPVACFSAYVSVLLVKRLQHGDFWPDMLDVALYVIYCTLLLFIPLIGWVLIPYILYKHYDTSFVDLIIMAVVYVVLSSVLQYLLFFVVEILAGTLFGAV